MALTDESNGNGFYMPVAPAYGYGGGNGNNGFGGDWGWIILLLLCGWGGMGFGGMGGWGGFGNMALGYDFPWLLNGQNQINSNTNNGFRDAMINDGITSVRDGINGLSTQLCNCCSDMQMSLANGFRDVSMQMANSDMAALNRSFAEQTANAQGFAGVNSGIADLRYTIAAEACATRTANAQNTQAILDKLCQQELDAERRDNANLRSELMYARGQASQVEQTARILAGQAAEIDGVYNRLKNCPVGTVPVFGNQPIFTCPTNVGSTCGCGNF